MLPTEIAIAYARHFNDPQRRSGALFPNSLLPYTRQFILLLIKS